MMLCMSCGNIDEFQRVEHLRVYASEIAYIDGNDEETTNWDGYEENDRETYETSDLRCSECSSADVEAGLEEKDRVDLIWRHTNKAGDWCKEELPEKERSEEIIEEYALEVL